MHEAEETRHWQKKIVIKLERLNEECGTCVLLRIRLKEKLEITAYKKHRILK